MEVLKLGSNQSCSCRLNHSHGNTGSELHLQTTPQLRALQILNPLNKARNRIQVLMDLLLQLSQGRNSFFRDLKKRCFWGGENFI